MKKTNPKLKAHSCNTQCGVLCKLKCKASNLWEWVLDKKDDLLYNLDNENLVFGLLSLSLAAMLHFKCCSPLDTVKWALVAVGSYKLLKR